jgi:hypothetical protein
MENDVNKDVVEEFIATDNEENPEPDYKGFILNPYSRKLIQYAVIRLITTFKVAEKTHRIYSALNNLKEN